MVFLSIEKDSHSPWCAGKGSLRFVRCGGLTLGKLLILCVIIRSKEFMLFLMVGREGFEPSKAEPPDLQSGAFGHFATDPRITNLTDAPRKMTELLTGRSPDAKAGRPT